MSEETGTKIITDQEKREQLREKIEAAEARNEERSFGDYAKEAAETATEFAKKHPLATVAGVVGLGFLIGAMTKPGRRLGRRGGAMAAFAADAALAYGLNAFDRASTGASAAARTGSDKFQDVTDAIGSAARNFRRDAAYRTDVATDTVKATSRKASRRASRTIRDLRSRLTH